MIEIYNPAMLKNIEQTRTQHSISKRKQGKATHVPTACLNCKKAHLACDLSRPCKRCSAVGKCDTCIDIKHKKRGRPKLADGLKKPIKNKSVMAPPLTPLNNFVSLLPMTAPGLAACSFSMTQPNNKNKLPTNVEKVLPPSEMMTIFLSMDLCCARVSDEAVEFLSTNPNDVGHCSFYDLIHPDSSETLSRIHRMLLDNSHSTRVPQQQPISFTTSASSDLFLSSSPAQLFQIANGSQTLRETLKFKSTGRSLSCRFYLGGGFGADLFIPTTLDHLYMVCIISELNSITSASNIANQVPVSFEQDQLDSILNNTDIMSMYDNSLPTESEALRLVNHLCDSFMTPSTPPEGYNSGSDCSIDSQFLEYIPPQSNCKSLEIDALLDNALLDNTLLDESMFLFSPQVPESLQLSRWENNSAYPDAM